MHFALAALLLATPVPPEAQPSSSPKVPLIVAGTIIEYVAYGAPVATAAVYGVLVVPFIAAAHSRVPTDPFLLFIPVAGPLLVVHNDSLDNSQGLKNLLYFDAAAQAVGIALLIAGFASGPPAARTAWRPTVGPAGFGLSRRF